MVLTVAITIVIMVAMDWTLVIKDLLDSGMTQAQIADACDTGQSHISSIYRGDRKVPNWSLGDRLLALRNERCGDKKAA